MKKFLILLLLFAVLLPNLSHAAEISVVTFNVCGGRSGEERGERFLGIFNILKDKRWDVVFLQEAFDRRDREMFKKECGYDHSVDLERHGYLKPDSGVLILSKYS